MTSSISVSCPSCKAPILSSSSPLCPNCTSLISPPLNSTTHFSLFDLPLAFDVDQKDLKQKFLKWQQLVHPDLYSGKGEELIWAQEWSRRINDSFKILQGDRSRGEYLLDLENFTVGETDSVTDPELLMTIMETREAVDEAQSEEEVAEIRERNKINIATTIQDLSGAFKETPPDFPTAKNLVIQLRYLENVDGVCKEWRKGTSNDVRH